MGKAEGTASLSPEVVPTFLGIVSFEHRHSRRIATHRKSNLN
jgi:hypothetical protein